MSTAVLISGQLREFARCYPSQKWHVYRRHEPCEFFIVVQRQPDAEELLAPLRADYPGRVHVKLLDDPELPITPAMSAAYHHAPFANAAPLKNLLLQHWYQEKVFDFFRERSAVSGQQFDVIIRQRADNFFHEYRAPDALAFLNGESIFAPWWGNFGGVNDRFAVMQPEVAPHYFGVYSAIEGLLAAGCPFHPESLTRASVEAAGYSIAPVHALFSTARPKGHPQHPQRWPEILPWERPAA